VRVSVLGEEGVRLFGLFCFPLMLTAGFIGSFSFLPRQHAPLTSALASQSVCSTSLCVRVCNSASSFLFILLFSVFNWPRLAVVGPFTSLNGRAVTSSCKIGQSPHHLVSQLVEMCSFLLSGFSFVYICGCQRLLLYLCVSLL